MFRRLFPLDDLGAFLRSRNRHQRIAAGVSLGMTVLIMTIFLIESRWGYPERPPTLIYVNSWSANRSLAEVEAQQATELAARKQAIAVQKAEDARLAAEWAKKPPTHG